MECCTSVICPVCVHTWNSVQFSLYVCTTAWFDPCMHAHKDFCVVCKATYMCTHLSYQIAGLVGLVSSLYQSILHTYVWLPVYTRVQRNMPSCSIDSFEWHSKIVRVALATSADFICHENKFTLQRGMLCFNHASAFHTSNNIAINDK